MTGAIEHGALIRDDGVQPDRVDFTFNPTTVVIKKSAMWQDNPRSGQRQSPHGQFVGTRGLTIDFKLLFDAWAAQTRDVSEKVQTLLDWTCATEETSRSGRPQPPLVHLHWGSAKYFFRCYLKEVTATYTLFDEEGLPKRAEVQVILAETPPDRDGQNPTSGGVAGNRVRILTGEDALPSVSYAEYGTPTMWRALALANDIDDPMRVPAGTELFVPSPTAARDLPGGRRA